MHSALLHEYIGPKVGLCDDKNVTISMQYRQ